MVRKAVNDDVPDIFGIIDYFAKKGIMLHRTVADITDHLRDFFVYEEEGRIIGTCALQISAPEIAEIRSLAVKHTGRGIGRELVNACIEEARSLKLKRVFALTYKTGFFHRLGFRTVNKEILPHKIWGDCIKCVKFPNCDETAVIADL